MPLTKAAQKRWKTITIAVRETSMAAPGARFLAIPRGLPSRSTRYRYGDAPYPDGAYGETREQAVQKLERMLDEAGFCVGAVVGPA